MKTKTDTELLAEGVSVYLIDYRNRLNKEIKQGKRFCRDANGQKVQCVRAFISNPCGYDKVYLLGINNEILEQNLELQYWSRNL